MKAWRRVMLAVLLLLGGSTLLWGQKKAPKDSLFRLLEAERAEQYEQYGVQYRLVKGHARFLHNDTYLLCDSASWNVDRKFIEAFGNVQIIQNKTMLKSEEMLYWIDENKALFRGGLVELLDKDGNILRTERLTYNTKDSVAVFEYGGSMKEKGGNVIESYNGTYDAKEGLFTFDRDVELYMDSIEIKTNTLHYFTDTERAHFGKNTHLWRDQGFLRADAGWWDRPTRVAHFNDHVFMFDPSYDAWSDEVYYYQDNGAVDLYYNAQVLDSTNKSVYLGDHLQYMPADSVESQRGLLTGNPAIIYYGENENHVVDTLYARADTFYVYAVPRCNIPADEVKEAERRIEDMMFDALAKKRAEEAEEREKERIQKMRDVGKLPPEWVERQRDSLAAVAAADSLARLDSLAKAEMPGQIDSLSVIPEERSEFGNLDSLATATADSLAVVRDSVPDTTPVRYVLGWHHVRMFRSDLQGACDSVVFCELDSIARLYGEPVLWNEVRNQLTAEEMQLLMRNGAVDRGSMITNAWLISQQDSTHFDQIKSTEMLGYFRDNQIYRFDALGGVSAIFYMVDENVITTINVKESKSLTAAMKDGQAQRLLYMESIKSDAYPVGDLAPEKQRLKDFKWRGDERPVSREEITTRQMRTTERAKYENLLKPLYRQTNKYFDNYIFNLLDSLNNIKLAERERRQREKDSIAQAKAQQEALLQQAMPDSLNVDEGFDIPAPVDTVFHNLVVDSTFVSLDSTAVERPQVELVVTEGVVVPKVKNVEEEVAASPETVVQSKQLTRAEKRALRRAERKARREARRAARLARRAERKALRQKH